MNRRNHQGLLHFCDGQGGWPGSRGRYARLPEPVEYSLCCVNRHAVKFSLPEALAANRLVSTSDTSAESLRARWTSPQCLWDDLGVRADAVDRKLAEMPAVIIGWDPKGHYGQTDSVLCKDIELTLAVLGRTVGGIFFAGREPDYSLENLLAAQLIVDEHLPTDHEGPGGGGEER